MVGFLKSHIKLYAYGIFHILIWSGLKSRKYFFMLENAGIFHVLKCCKVSLKHTLQ